MNGAKNNPESIYEGDIKSKGFFEKFMFIRLKNKQRLVRYLQKERNDATALDRFDLKVTIFEGFLKKVTSSARHLMLVLYVVKRYLYLKSLVAKKV